jgi:hypothetical protein
MALRSKFSWLVCNLVVLAALTGSVWAQEAAPHKQVLTLYAVRRDAELATIGETQALDTGLNRRLDYYSEFIDLARFPEARYQAAFGDFLRFRFQSIQFDLVIARGDAAIGFVAREISVQLTGDADGLTLSIIDDGIGFDVKVTVPRSVLDSMAASTQVQA